MFHKVAECLYRHESSGTHYGLVKRSGKQFRRSLKADDRQLASRRLADLREKAGKLSNVKSARRITFKELSERWFGTVRGGLKKSSAGRIETCIGQLKPYFANSNIRNISRATRDEWVMPRCHVWAYTRPQERGRNRNHRAASRITSKLKRSQRRIGKISRRSHRSDSGDSARAVRASRWPWPGRWACRGLVCRFTTNSKP